MRAHRHTSFVKWTIGLPNIWHAGTNYIYRICSSGLNRRERRHTTFVKQTIWLPKIRYSGTIYMYWILSSGLAQWHNLHVLDFVKWAGTVAQFTCTGFLSSELAHLLSCAESNVAIKKNCAEICGKISTTKNLLNYKMCVKLYQIHVNSTSFCLPVLRSLVQNLRRFPNILRNLHSAHHHNLHISDFCDPETSYPRYAATTGILKIQQIKKTNTKSIF